MFQLLSMISSPWKVQNCPLVLSMSQTIWNQILSSSMTCTVYQISLSCLFCLTYKGIDTQSDSWGLYEHSIASISKVLRTVGAPYMCLLNKYACSSWLPRITSHLSRRNASFPEVKSTWPGILNAPHLLGDPPCFMKYLSNSPNGLDTIFSWYRVFVICHFWAVTSDFFFA